MKTKRIAVLAFIIVVLLVGTFSVASANTYDRTAAVTWASQHNYNDGSFRGATEGRWCTTYIGLALNAGGLNTATNWYGNQQIVQWMLANPSLWEDKPIDQLVAGDFVLYSSDSNAPGDWSYIYPGGYSRWEHVALVIAPGRVAAWNAEQYDVSITGYDSSGFYYRKGVHIRDSNPPSTEVIVNPPNLTPAYGDQCGTGWYQISGYAGQPAYLTLNTNQAAQSSNSGEWRPTLPQTGQYRVEAYISTHGDIPWPCLGAGVIRSNDTSDARYAIFYSGGSTSVARDQLPVENAWIDLGTYSFAAGTTGYVTLRDLNGEADFTRLISFSAMRFTLIAAATPPAAPSNLGATAASQTGINLTWTDNSTDETNFKIERSPDGATGWAQIDLVGANVTTYANGGLTCGTPYYYRVRATNANGDSGYSTTANATTVVCSPAAPTGLRATAASPTQINLLWTDASNNETGFKIERSPDGVNGWSQIGTVGANVTTYANTGLTSNPPYFYRVRATNAGGDSVYSNVASVLKVYLPVIRR